MSEQANTTAAAEVSSEYLSDIRLRVRSSVDKLDGEIKDLILAARADLMRGGVLPARAADETDPLVKQAISTYARPTSTSARRPSRPQSWPSCTTRPERKHNPSGPEETPALIFSSYGVFP